jgi:hypothetical protein
MHEWEAFERVARGALGFFKYTGVEEIDGAFGCCHEFVVVVIEPILVVAFLRGIIARRLLWPRMRFWVFERDDECPDIRASLARRTAPEGGAGRVLMFIALGTRGRVHGGLPPQPGVFGRIQR